MKDFIIVATDTDVGKTTFATQFLTEFASAYEYWKPLETGPADSATIRERVPDVVVHPSLFHFDEAVAPLLAARNVGVTLPSASEIAARRPMPAQGRGLIIETFGGPFSPLNEVESQTELIRALRSPIVLVSSTKLGAIGRTVQAMQAMEAAGIGPMAVVLLGPRDEFAEERIAKEVAPAAVYWGPTAASKLARGFATSPNRGSERSLADSGQVAKRQANFDAADWVARDRKNVWHPYTPLQSDDPLLATGAAGEWIQLADGRRVLDGISSWWTILHGHRHPPLVRAFYEALESWDHVHFAGVTHAPAIELAELLLSTMPWTGGRAFYSDNGSTAVEVALKLAYQTWRHRGEPGRTRFVGFENGYHGDTFGAMAVGRDPLFFGHFEPLLFRADIVPLDPDRLDEHLKTHASETAAVIVEPRVQGAGGMRMHSAQTLRDLAAVAKRHGLFFIADEVMTGGGRTGTLWAFQSAGIVPDLVCASKTLTGGTMPLAATLIAPEIVREFDSADRRQTFFHGHSFTAHPLACAVAVANWRELTRAFPEAPGKMESFWTSAFAGLDARVLGSIAAIQLDDPGGYLADVGKRLRAICLADGVLLRPLGSVLYAMPPYCTSQENLERIAKAMLRAVSASP